MTTMTTQTKPQLQQPKIDTTSTETEKKRAAAERERKCDRCVDLTNRRHSPALTQFSRPFCRIRASRARL
jgi:hypothetical protein